MCIVIDTCCLSFVFDKDNSEHYKFVPILKWVESGNGKIVYGGSKYKKELKTASKFVSIFAEYNRKGKTVELSDHQVNKITKEVRQNINDGSFNDEHLVAIVIASRCCVVCTVDKNAQKMLKQQDLYPKKYKQVKIYQYLRNKNLCCDRNIVGACR